MRPNTPRQLVSLTPADCGRALLRYRFAVLAVLLLGGAGAALVSFTRTPLYRASTQVLFAPNFPRPDITQLDAGGNYVLQRTTAYADFAGGPDVTAAVIDRLHLPESPAELTARVTASTKAGSAVITISVVDPRPELARDIADAMADELVDFIPRVETPAGATQSPVKASVVRRATLPASPDSPHTATNIGLGLVAGLVAGAVGAVVRYGRDPTVRTAGHLAALAGAPLLDVMPADLPVPPVVDPEPAVRAEARRQLEATVRLRAAGRRFASVAVAGTVPGDGASAVTAELAVALARSGETVILIDGNPRNPEIGRRFPVPATVGLADVLRGTAELADATHQWRPDLPLYVLPAGQLAGQPFRKLICSPEFAKVLEALWLRSALVVIDVPALLSDAEALALLQRCDMAILAARVGHSPADGVRTATEAVRAAQVTVLGVIATQ